MTALLHEQIERADREAADRREADARVSQAEAALVAERQGREAERTRADAAEDSVTGLRALLEATEARKVALERAEAERAAWPRWRRL